MKKATIFTSIIWLISILGCQCPSEKKLESFSSEFVISPYITDTLPNLLSNADNIEMFKKDSECVYLKDLIENIIIKNVSKTDRTIIADFYFRSSDPKGGYDLHEKISMDKNYSFKSTEGDLDNVIKREEDIEGKGLYSSYIMRITQLEKLETSDQIYDDPIWYRASYSLHCGKSLEINVYAVPKHKYKKL